MTHASASMMPIRLGKSSSEIPAMHKFKSGTQDDDLPQTPLKKNEQNDKNEKNDD